MSKASRRTIAVVVAAVAVFAAFSIATDVGAIRDRLAGFAWWAFFAALGLAIGNYVIRFIRWTLYLRLRGIHVPARSSAVVFVSGFALAVTPGKVGELIKSYLLRAIHDVPVTSSAPIVIAERVSDLLALIILAVIGVAVYGVAIQVVVGAAALVGFGLLVLAWNRLGHGIIALVTRIKRLRHLEPKLLALYDGLAELSRPSTLTWSSALGVAAWLCECIGFAVIVNGFAGADVPLGLATLIYAATTIAGALSFLPGGLIVTEGAMTALLVKSSSVDKATAFAATILTRLATLWFAVLLGVIAMAIARRLAPAGAALGPDDGNRPPSPAPPDQ